MESASSSSTDKWQYAGEAADEDEWALFYNAPRVVGNDKAAEKKLAEFNDASRVADEAAEK